ncbi:MAG: inorganic phosphate transporter [Bacteroidales bacterium]
MEHFYLVLVIVLFVMAISDLIVGVANDAVNFLNSAVGSKAAPMKIIFIVAAVGVLSGVLFSGGMMEVARSGIFNPEKFTFAHVMVIFLAVMITDVVLLDLFNTMGLPTSTTVSLVFELLGAAVGVAIIKVSESLEPTHISEYINSAKALAIIFGILLSVVLAFAAGSFLQFLTRLIFTFDFERRFQKWGALFSSLGITMILYFLLLKGAKGATFMTEQTQQWIDNNQFVLILCSFVLFSLLFKILQIISNINILKIVVLSGTFALAMAFAGNDLVNFIGVPLAGLDSYMHAVGSGSGFENMTMEMLNNKVAASPFILLGAGIIMVITLYKSRKARKVIETELNLGRQEQGYERFDSTQLSRALVRLSLKLSEQVQNMMPETIKRVSSRRFEPVQTSHVNGASFDMLRASVNLLASSALIALGTSFKLPLSTTYVTFMVAMGTSLADGAWGRDSAVYRVTGVLSVIGGWFLTAVSAFTIAMLLAIIIFHGGIVALSVILLIAMYLIYRTQKFTITNDKKVSVKVNNDAWSIASDFDFLINETSYAIQGFGEKLLSTSRTHETKGLKILKKELEGRSTEIQILKNKILVGITGDLEKDVEKCNRLVSIAAASDRILNGLVTIITLVVDHIQNNHKDFSAAQMDDLEKLALRVDVLVKDMVKMDFSHENTEQLIQLSEDCKRNEISRIRNNKESTRNSLLFISIIQEFKYFLYNIQRIENLIKYQG